MNNPVVVMTLEQVRELAKTLLGEMNAGQGNPEPKQPSSAKRYVYGLRGIRDLFNVSISTAQRYKNTWLAPAIMQNGRRFMIDADMAIELYGKVETCRSKANVI